MIVDPYFLEHWKTKALIEELEDPMAPLYVLRFWLQCQQRKTDRINATPEVFASICGVPKEKAAKFVQTMRKLRFVNLRRNSLQAHGFEQRNSQLFANWRNGKRGGRPVKSTKSGSASTNTIKPNHNPTAESGKPKANPTPESGKPNRNPSITDKIRLDKNKRRAVHHNRNQHSTQSREVIQHAEAKLWLNELFQNKQPWSYEEDKLLDDLLPIEIDDQEAISWAHKLPPDHPIHEQTKLKQSRLTLLREFGAEVDKIRRMRRQLGYFQKNK